VVGAALPSLSNFAKSRTQLPTDAPREAALDIVNAIIALLSGRALAKRSQLCALAFSDLHTHKLLISRALELRDAE